MSTFLAGEPTRTIALDVSAGEPTLAGIRPPLERALGWAAGLLLLALLLPVRVESGITVWPTELLFEPLPILCFFAWFVSAIALFALGRWSRSSRLTKSIVACFLLLVIAVSIASWPDRANALLALGPRSVRDAVVPLFIGIGFIGAATRWRIGLEGLARNQTVAITLTAIAGAAMLIAYVMPGRDGPIVAEWFDAVITTFAWSTYFDERRAAITTLVITTLPAGLVIFGAWRALRPTGTDASASAWILALTPSVVFTLGLKGAAMLGADAYVLIGVADAAMLLGTTLVMAFAVDSGLRQLHDPLGADCHHPTRLLRDELLFDAMLASPNKPPDFETALAGYRPIVRRLVADRFMTLLAEVAQEHSHLAPYGVVHDDMLRLLAGDVSVPATEPPPTEAPRASWFARWAGRGRRAELCAFAAAVAFGWSLVGARAIIEARPDPWRVTGEALWATKLYRDLIPRIAIAAGRDSHRRPDLVDAATEDAAEAAAPLPELARSIRALGRAARDVDDHRHSLVRTTERLNEVAQEAGIPFYVDANVVGFKSGDTYDWTFYLKTYRIRRTRRAHVGQESYDALWLERLDRTNIVEAKLGWTKRDQPRGMVILDVVRDYWRDDLAPALSGASRISPLAAIYDDHADRIEMDLADALDRVGFTDAVAPSVRLERFLSCVGRGEVRYADEWREPVDVYSQQKHIAATAEREVGPYCHRARESIEPMILEVLAMKIEVHEVQHVADGRELSPPKALRRAMSGYTEESIDFATAELSAYLAEIAHSNLPRLSLVHFMAVAAQRGRSPEGFAGEVAEATLTKGGTTIDELLTGPTEELRSAAKTAYADLFGHDLPAVTITEAPLYLPTTDRGP